jgi:hypothetical protein
LHIGIGDICFATGRLGQGFTADVARNLVHGAAEDKLLIVTLAASDAQEAAFRFWNKFVPFSQGFFPPDLSNN